MQGTLVAASLREATTVGRWGRWAAKGLSEGKMQNLDNFHGSQTWDTDQEVA